MNLSSKNEVTATFHVQPSWVPNPDHNPLAWQSAAEWNHRQKAFRRAQETQPPIGHSLQAAVTALNERYGTPQCVAEAKQRQPGQSPSTWPGWYSSSDMIAIALGAPEPRWIGGYWWGEWEKAPLQAIDSPDDVAKVQIPDWSSLEITQRLLASRQRWQRECPEEPPSPLADMFDVLVPGQEPVPSICYPSFVDLGIYLMGMENFLALLGRDRETADALMDLCFELSTSYVDFLLRQQPEQFSGLVGFGGDNTCMLSPELYDRYGAAWDKRLLRYVQEHHGLSSDAPCNLHSCGPSSHLYARWAAHPCRRNITMMQTRLIPGQAAALRESLQETILQLTLHPPHFDIVSAAPDELRDVLWNTARDTGQCNLEFYIVAVVHHEKDLEKVEQALDVCAIAIGQMRNTLLI